MGYASLFEDSQDVKFQAFEITERLKLENIAANEAEKLVNGLLKRCKCIQDAMSDISSLHSDLSRDTRNRIYTLRIALEEARDKIESLEAELREQKKVK